MACLLIMFCLGRLAMPPLEHDDVRHATLLFCAEGVNVRTMGVVKTMVKYGRKRDMAT